MSRLKLEGKYVMVDGISYFQDDVLGLVRMDRPSGQRRENSDVDDLQGPLEYKGIDADILVRRFRGFHIPGQG